MKRYFLLILLAFACLSAAAQEPKEEFARKYNNLVGRVGPAGLGVETLLDKWQAAWPDDPQQQVARFAFCFARCQSTAVIQLDKDRYLGREPIVPMTDSLGRKCNWFEDPVFDEALYAEANLAIDRAICLDPWRLDYRMAKIDAMTAYEKGEPEMATHELKSLADKHFKEHPVWKYQGLGEVSEEQFKAFMQDYCAALFRLGTERSAECFKGLSEHLLQYCKDEPMYLDNLGSYYLVKKEYKKALKYFDQVLKKHPGDQTALRNGLLLARAKQDVKLEKKYLAQLARYGESETDRKSAQVRLEALEQKR